jgi:hypothetical protein
MPTDTTCLVLHAVCVKRRAFYLVSSLELVVFGRKNVQDLILDGKA